MRIYWHGDGKVVRIPLKPGFLPRGGVREDVTHTLAAQLGFPLLLDWGNQLTEGDEVLVFVPEDANTAPTVPGREDLEAEWLIVWMRGGVVANLFFARTIADLVTTVSMIASYEKALCDITEYRQRFLEIRGRQARYVE